MRITRSTAVAAASALFLSLLGVTGAGVASAISATPTFEPDPDSVGTVLFYDAAGTQITSGLTTDTPFATYYKASGPKTGAFTFNLGNVTLYTPQDGVATASWTTGEQITSSENYTTAQPGYPAGLNNPATNVVIKGLASDNTMASHITNFPSASAANAGVYQIRVYTSTSATTYYTADIKVTGTAWTQVYPTVITGTATTTALAVTPASPVTVGDNVTLTATVSPTGAVGSVQFYDGVNPIGSPVAVSSDTAATSTTSLTVATHNLKATFVPTDSAAWATSTSSITPFTVAAVPLIATTTTIVSSRTGSALPGATARLTASVLAANLAGSVQFYDRNVAVGAPVAVVSGTAVLASTGALGIATHSFKATFVPTLSTYASSTSVAVALRVAKVASVIKATVVKVKVALKPRLAFAISVSAVGVVPGGRVYLYKLVGKTYVKLGYAVLKAGKVTVVLPALTKGYHYIKLTFAGTTQVLASAKVVRVLY